MQQWLFCNDLIYIGFSGFPVAIFKVGHCNILQHKQIFKLFFCYF